MKYLAWAAVIFLSLLLQDRVSVFDAPLNLTVVLTYFAGIRYGESRGLLTGAGIGILEDSLAASILGPHFLAKGVIGYFSSFFVSGGFFIWTPTLGILAISVLTFANNIIIYVARSVFDVTPAGFSTVIFFSAVQAIINAPAGAFIRPRHED